MKFQFRYYNSLHFNYRMYFTQKKQTDEFYKYIFTHVLYSLQTCYNQMWIYTLHHCILFFFTSVSGHTAIILPLISYRHLKLPLSTVPPHYFNNNLPLLPFTERPQTFLHFPGFLNHPSCKTYLNSISTIFLAN